MSQAPNDIIERIVSNAHAMAARNHHEYTTLEHLLYILLRDDSVKHVMKQCNVDVSIVNQDLELAMSEIARVPDMGQATTTPAFWRVIQGTMQHYARSGHSTLLPSHVLVHFFDEEPGTVALAILLRQNLSRVDITRVLSHGSRIANGQVSPTGKAEAEDALANYTTDLNAKAIANDLDPLVGRHREIERMVQVLGRRRKNNPLLVGDPGVGKTAIAEGLAQRIVAGDVPQRLKDYKLHSLNLGAIVAGTKYRGDFEERWKALLEQVASRPEVVLFIDEIHNLVGAGAGGKGALDAANLIKPALSSGKLRIVGSTTFEEYRGVFEKDAALSRRFQKIDVVEPTPAETIEILNGLLPQLESYHKLRFSASAVSSAVRLSVRYQPEKRLPDKAIDLLDEAASRLRSRAEPSPDDLIAESDIEATLSAIAHIPIARASSTDRNSLLNLRPRLDACVFGQTKATEAVASAMVMSKAGLAHPDRPMGSFLFSGPTGVGKTETARQLAEILGLKLIRFDMSEYRESHTVARLIGAPPGYVGFDKGGLLTEAITQSPHAVLLLDEIEKANPDIYNLLLQIMDAGRLTDTNGRTVDFRHVVLIMTTNAGAGEAVKRTMGFVTQSTKSDLAAAISHVFAPEFRNRLDAIIAFQALGPQEIEMVVRKFINQVAAQIAERGVHLSLSERAIHWLCKKGFDHQMGARPLDRTINDHVKKPLAASIMFGDLTEGGNAVFDVDQAGEALFMKTQPRVVDVVGTTQQLAIV